jgi:ABC-type multidrug transport system ATPase subunit
MGPSGSGKTTLLSVLGGRPPKLLEAEGSVKVNGRPLSKAGRRRIGYVLQVGAAREPCWLMTAASLC